MRLMILKRGKRKRGKEERERDRMEISRKDSKHSKTFIIRLRVRIFSK